jgi:poly-gamma-glutamate capsule biosynthesis protein CapA/YwtB (metallophosphatase superfamily)
VSVAAVGDTMMGTPGHGLPPDDGAGFFDAVADALAADVSLVNLEGTLSEGGVSKCPALGEDATDEERAAAGSCFAFQTPPAFAPRLAEAGFTVANLANNHSHDFGGDGLAQTVAALEGAGVMPTGLSGTSAQVAAGGLSIAVLGFAPYEWADPLLDLDAAAARVAETAAVADLVIVTFHGGGEGAAAATTPVGAETYLGENRGDLRAFARAVIDAGADLVVGHGPHVLRGMEVYEDRLIAYSLGNFAGYGTAFNLTGPLSVSMVLHATLAPDGTFVDGRIVPTVLGDRGLPAPGGDAIGTVRRLSQEDFGASSPVIADDGTMRPPPTPPVAQVGSG